MSKDSTPAVILSHGEGGLGAARSLARRGIDITAIAYDADDAILYSRRPAKRLSVSGGTHDEKERQILEILRSLPHEGAALLTTSDRLVTLISNHRDALLGKFRFALPPKDLLDTLNNKSQEVELLGSLGFDIPRTVTELPHDPAALAEELRFPIIFKPHSYAAAEFFPKKNGIVQNEKELREFYDHWKLALQVLLAQEVIAGPDTNSWVCSCTFDHNHRLLDCGVKQKIRCMPIHFGGSVYAVSRGNQAVVDLARKIGAKLKYVGHAGLEFRWDDRDQCYRYIELNPRFPANVGFDEACGLPTVWNSYLVALGDNPGCSNGLQREGVYFLDLNGDQASLRADKTPSLQVVVSLLSHFTKRTSGLFFAWDDPLPGLVVGHRFLVRKLRKLWSMIWPR